MKLKRYQVEGVQQALTILKSTPSALIADEMGLGKTVQAIYVLKELQPARTLVICPASLTYNWQSEFYLWSPHLKKRDLVQVVKEPTTKVDIISYNMFIGRAEKFYGKYDFVILDEAHYIKSPKSKRSKAVFKLLADGTKSLMLTGTPMPSHTRDLFALCRTALYGKHANFQNPWSFYRRYCDAKRTRFGWDTTGTSNEEELKPWLKSFMVRRFKKDVLQELPDKIISHVSIPLDTIKATEYAKESLNLIQQDEAIDLERMKLAPHVMTARQRLGELKVKSAISFIKDKIEAAEKPVVFAFHKKVLEALRDAFPAAAYIDGSTSSKDRQTQVERFQNGDTNIFIGQIIAAGTGITLTEGTCCIFVETDWNPGNNEQAEDRIHRIGQKRVVNIYYLSARNSLDYSINSLLVKKARNINLITGE